MSEIAIKVDHLTRVEGHGNIILNAKNGAIEKVQWQVTEAPRMFESFVRGRHYHQVSHVMSRICGICSIGHALCSLKATEAAMSVTISEQTELLRKVALHAENMQSHILHVGYLVAPDLFRKGSVFPLIETHPDAVLKIIALHRLANEMSDLLCGRTTHPITLMVGGFTSTPSERELSSLRDRLSNILPVCDEVNQLLLDNVHMLPDFTRETEYIGLTSDTEYALYDGVIGSTDTGTHPVEDYESIANEYVVPYSTAKFASHARESYMVGALARFNLNAEKLTSGARAWAQKFGLSPISYNPFMNNVAQLIEYYHSVEDSIALIDTILNKGLKNETPSYAVKAGRGVGAVEVPRGILFHDYTYNDKGFCTRANCVIPTNQNHKNINLDLEALAPTLLGLAEKEIELNLEMLVRAYDPCISCSTHYLTVEFT
ncbi:MAG: Ni/Fe hydrogenase subunit alpha [Theionarchaea archaeon]|nr:Ni/Fe hydrogenase subunit alpha [Theionarchaea archaeon]MBU7000490.1 Ni/Fe hydrogenase subunit alpha [Theionarchaea archaeon]MBU7019984.1 Ni/Fe hydrogenase subunit alpha [Theionarchaea archaeon]MBU7035235.1 Ni/Fe hydrogenase subunit alpha [Theionarchaea archaeon]MBU7040554.1 Ni/Fe hydrogenase subunit alpha [Theionarchaea archaeon]